MRLAIFQYKCRRCDKIVERSICREEDGIEILNKLMNGLKSEKVLYAIPSYYDVHICNDKEIGICDLIGFRIEKE